MAERQIHGMLRSLAGLINNWPAAIVTNLLVNYYCKVLAFGFDLDLAFRVQVLMTRRLYRARQIMVGGLLDWLKAVLL